MDFDFLKNFNEIKNYFNASTIQFNEYFFKDLKRKIDNMLYYIFLKIIKEENIVLFNYLFSSKKITKKDIAKSYFSLDLRLKDLFPSAPYDLDKKNIFKSLKSKWYKCTYEHLYTSDEVENYNNVLSCPHCTFGEKAITMMKKIVEM